MKELKDLILELKPIEKIIILGNGKSMIGFEPNENIFYIGVNDINKIFSPNIHLLVDGPSRFSRERIKNIQKSKSNYFLFKKNSWERFLPEDKTYIIEWERKRGSHHLNNNDKVNIGYDSPFVASMIAYKLGAKHIGLLGVDYTRGHFYDNAEHPIIKNRNYFKRNLNLYEELYKKLKDKNINFFNLSEISKINVVPYLDIKKFYNL